MNKMNSAVQEKFRNRAKIRKLRNFSICEISQVAKIHKPGNFCTASKLSAFSTTPAK